MNKVSKFSKTNLLYNFNIAGRTSGMSYTELHFIVLYRFYERYNAD